MIVLPDTIIDMNEIDKPCLELNEIIYHITGEFWKQAYYGLLAQENKLKCKAFSHNEHFYVSLIPYPIYIVIERETGDFSISVLTSVRVILLIQNIRPA